MTRDDVRKTFPEATDEQVKTIMDLHGADIERTKGAAGADSCEADRPAKRAGRGKDHPRHAGSRKGRRGTSCRPRSTATNRRKRSGRKRRRPHRRAPRWKAASTPSWATASSCTTSCGRAFSASLKRRWPTRPTKERATRPSSTG